MRAGILTSTTSVFVLRLLLAGLGAATVSAALLGAGDATAEVAASAQVGVSAQFVDPVGIRHTAEMAIPSARKAEGVSVRLGATPAAFATVGADGRVVSMETAASLAPLSGQPAAGAQLRARSLGQAQSLTAGRPIEVAAEAALSAAAPAGAYQGSYSVVMNLN